MASQFKSLKTILILSLSVHLCAVAFIGAQIQREESRKEPSTFSLAFGTPKKLGTPGEAKKVLKKEVVTSAPALKTKAKTETVVTEQVATLPPSTGPIGNGGSPDGTNNGSTDGDGGSPNGLNTPQARYNSLLSRIINEHKSYPRMARALHHEGRVLVRVTLDKEGNLKNLELIEKATYQTLTTAAMETIRKVGKFPPVPSELGADDYTFKVPVDYKITL